MISSEKPYIPEYLEDDDPLASTTKRQLFSLTGFLRVCLDNGRLILKIVGFVLLLAVAYLLLRTPQYVSTASLMPPDSSSSTSGLLSLLASTPGASAVSASGLLPGVRAPGAIFVGVLQSRTVRQALVDQYQLQDYYRVKLPEDACRHLLEATTVVENPKNGIVTISVEDRDPRRAADLANAYTQQLDRLMTQNTTSAARRERVFLEGRLKQIKEDLNSSAKAFSAFASKNRAIDIPSQAKAMMEAGLRLETEMGVARSELAGLRQTYSADNPRIRAAEARIAELQHQVATINGGTKETAEPGTSDYPSITSLPTLALTYSDLQRRALVDEALWSALTKQYETAKVQEAKELPTVRLLDVATVPRRATNATKATVLVLGLLLGVLSGVVAALLRAWWRCLPTNDERRELGLRLLPFLHLL